MNKYYVYVISVLIIFTLNKNIFSQTEEKTINTYDSLLAKKYGADDYGMKVYVMAFLKAGKIKSANKEESNKLQMEHLNNIIRLANEGKLLLAGPFMDNQEIRGIYIFDVKTIEEAEELTSTDPAIKAGVLEMELHLWYGSAALMELNKIHNTIQKSSITDQ
ncbi:MAG TPA: YciI family protein [Ignavibacteria bacterium]|nr:YciI family protein [Ignavibacteria bacterium]